MTNSGQVKALVTDLDNTLYDWEAFFIPSFEAMAGEVSRVSGLEKSRVEASFRRVYQRHRTTEYAFAIEELDVLYELDPHHSPEGIRRKYATAIDAFRKARASALHLYPSVRSTLESLRAEGVMVVAHSDSVIGYVSARLRDLGIDTYIDAIVAPEDEPVPAYRSNNATAPSKSRTRHITYDRRLRKPDPRTLAPALNALDIRAAESYYVGDSLSRDITLARISGIRSIWARYGSVHDEALRSQLLRITYWSDDEVRREAHQAIQDESIPDYTIDSFAEVLSIVTGTALDYRSSGRDSGTPRRGGLTW